MPFANSEFLEQREVDGLCGRSVNGTDTDVPIAQGSGKYSPRRFTLRTWNARKVAGGVEPFVMVRLGETRGTTVTTCGRELLCGPVLCESPFWLIVTGKPDCSTMMLLTAQPPNISPRNPFVWRIQGSS